MAQTQPRFKVPTETPSYVSGEGIGSEMSAKIMAKLKAAEADPDPNEKPTYVGPGKWLREKSTGMVYPWNDGMAMRSDLVEIVVEASEEVEDPDCFKVLEVGYETKYPAPRARL